eukprot:TRINITY_DN2035_c1_g1_i1.p1 TRINITY_DN2035_c1_g1~~TRINITY_DN2035_c1_g1_i1.p1  ORF type:complete len:181 (+),score=27.34 TRINITY_DN2035_c1_g1_i1:61-603(+)
MGAAFAKLFVMRPGQREIRIVMIGLDAAGKTTILHKMKIGRPVATTPTLGFNVETVQYNKVSFTVWDVGGQDRIRPLWRHYFQDTKGLIFVVDSNDRDRIDLARDELQRVLRDGHLADACVLVFANKQDLPSAMSTAEVADRLELASICKHPWSVQDSCATTGEGIFEGLDWIDRARKRW